MRRFLPLMAVLVAAVLLLPCSLLPATEIAGPDTLEPHECGWLWISGVTTELGVAWSPAEHLDLDPKHVKSGSALFKPQSAGRYKCDVILIDWENRGILILTHTVVVSGDGDDSDDGDDDGDGDDDENPPPVPPLKDLVVTIIEERDDAAKMGLEGSHLANHITEVNVYLASLGVRAQVIDDDQPGAAQYLARLEAAGVQRRPAFLVWSPKTKTFYTVRAFGKLGAETIQHLKAAGVKK